MDKYDQIEIDHAIMNQIWSSGKEIEKLEDELVKLQHKLYDWQDWAAEAVAFIRHYELNNEKSTGLIERWEKLKR